MDSLGERQPDTTPLAAAPPLPSPTFHALSPHFALDPAIPPEVRFLITVLYGLAFEEAIRNNESYRTFGATPLSVATSYDELAHHTGYNATRLAKIIRAAEALGLLKLTGSNRTGMRYHILVALRTYTKRDAPPARPVFAWDREVKQRRKQLALGEEEAAAAQPAPTIEPPSHKRNAEAYAEILALARTRDTTTQPGNVIFEAAVTDILDTLERRFPGNVATVTSRLVRDPRVLRAAHPVDYLRRGVVEGYILRPGLLPTLAPQTPEGAFAALPPGLQSALLAATRDGDVTNPWCRERDIPPLAADHARALVQAETIDANDLTDDFLHLPADLRDLILRAHERGDIHGLTLHILKTSTVLADTKEELRLGIRTGPWADAIVTRIHAFSDGVLSRTLTIDTQAK